MAMQAADMAAIAQALIGQQGAQAAQGAQPGMLGAQPDAQASQANMVSETHPSMDAAQARLQMLQDQGRLGYVMPVGPNGVYGYEVRHWAK